MVCMVRGSDVLMVAGATPPKAVVRSAVHVHPLWAVLLAMAVVVGCSPAVKRPPLAAASGTVTYNGSPLANALVSFLPADTSGNAVASGKTDANGSFVLSTFDVRDGAIPGEKLVVIVAQEGKDAREGNDPASPNYVPPKDLIPKKYFSVETSGLTATVEAGKKNTFQFALTDGK